MKNVLNKLSDMLYCGCKVFSAVVLGILAVLMFIGVIARYVFNNPIVWLNELTLVMFSWMVFSGVSVAMKNGENVTLDLFKKLSPLGKLIFAVLANISTLMFFYFIIKEGLAIIQSTHTEFYNTIPLSTAWFYVPLPLCGIFSLIHMLSAYTEKTNPLKKAQVTTEEEV